MDQHVARPTPPPPPPPPPLPPPPPPRPPPLPPPPPPPPSPVCAGARQCTVQRASGPVTLHPSRVCSAYCTAVTLSGTTRTRISVASRAPACAPATARALSSKPARPIPSRRSTTA